MKEELKQKMLDGISKEPNLRDRRMIAEKCAQIALEFFGFKNQALSMSGVSGSVCDKCHKDENYAGTPVCKECLLDIYDKQTDR